MPTASRSWKSYSPEYLQFAKRLAMNTPPTHYGPFSEKDALSFRTRFHHFRAALRRSPDREEDPTCYAARLYDLLDTLQATITKPYDDLQSYVKFQLDPTLAWIRAHEPELAEAANSKRQAFVASQLISTTAESINTDPIEPLFAEDN